VRGGAVQTTETAGLYAYSTVDQLDSEGP